VWSSTIRAKALDTVRGLLPASTLSNVGIYADGQAYEMAMVRMQTHPLTEVRYCGASMLEELRKVIPSFLSRVDLPERGMAWSRYLADVSTGLSELASGLGLSVSDQPAVRLIDWDPDAEVKLAAAALFSVSELSEVELLERARSMKAKDLAKVFRAMVGERSNRRHKPGRAMERTTYRFEVICDFGAFRDLQRHRMMTVEWQRLSAGLGYETPPDLEEAGLSRPWETSMERAADLYGRVRSELGGDVAQYVVPLAYRIRFVMEMNPRQAMHLIELRTQPAGHPSYRAVCQEMHRQIRDVAGHRLIADAMSFVDYSDVELERLESERRAEQRRQNAKVGA
jgi:thymidylate synthase ThyX